MSDIGEEARNLSAAIAGLEAQRGALGDAVVDPALATLRQQLSRLEAQSDAAASDERKTVTILFVDISGFTALSEKLDAEKVRDLINECFECLVPVVKKYDGTVDKFIGDEIMALFGAPVAHEDDPERALRAALEMMQAIGAFNRAHQTELGLHIGINTGPVVAGSVGASGRRDYSVMGDAVNLAARLEDASATGEIFVGPSTYRRTAKLFDFEHLPPLNLKGKEAPVEIYRLIGVKEAPERTRGIEGFRSPLVGREDELAEIRSAFAELTTGRGAVLSIQGEAGLGKSRLIAECRTLFGHLFWAEGRALSYTSGMSDWLAREILLGLIGARADSGPAKVASALSVSVEKTFGSRADEVYPYLAKMLELPLQAQAEERVKFLSAEALRNRVVETFGEYVRDRAAEGAVVLVWEDLHWCDPSSLQVLEQLAALVHEVPLLLLCATRPEEHPAAAVLAAAREK
ncbi:MAG: adenylate/guanylate cyclase domain-containing protein, partial [Chthoniobacterales bacterium]